MKKGRFRTWWAKQRSRFICWWKECGCMTGAYEQCSNCKAYDPSKTNCDIL